MTLMLIQHIWLSKRALAKRQRTVALPAIQKGTHRQKLCVLVRLAPLRLTDVGRDGGAIGIETARWLCSSIRQRARHATSEFHAFAAQADLCNSGSTHG
ncbi:MAG: hypothetical protein H6646_09010 [Anaerolineales bacterium]|nr:hypothetical protein [Anaerolineales bacterium]